ncbi:hypothetical protein OIU77_004116 [Salix suchowensis]|uniref:Uncharacterized protein n=1 Tax=Salix suchowensis TaxID=1278906 RepID=A0ABQ9ATB8_9ROSI|nr:hypothetical protein OIU77_004116 [Salix suchowensis]
MQPNKMSISHDRRRRDKNQAMGGMNSPNITEKVKNE